MTGTTTAHPAAAASGAPAAKIDLGGLTAASWDRLAGPHFYSSSGWLRFCDAYGGADQDAAVARENGAPVAAVPIAELREPLAPLYQWNAQLARYGLPTLPEGGLLVGPRQGYQTHLLTAPGRDPLAGVERLLELLRGRTGGGRACVAMYVTTPDALRVAQVRQDAAAVLIEADAWFNLPPGGWDAWLGSLPAKRRANIAREVRRFRREGFRIQHRPLADCYDRLAPLAEATQSKYGYAGGPEVHLAILRRHVECMGAAARVAICHRGDGDPVGFCVYYVWEGTLFLRWAGFDYSRLAKAAEYFNLVYYDPIMLAPELGVRRLHAGIKAPEAKALRGAELRPLWLVDLTEGSALGRRRDAVRDHNVRAYERLVAAVPVESGFGDENAWLAFGR